MSRILSFGLMAALWLCAHAAAAQVGTPELTSSAHPVLGAGMLPHHGWVELVVQIHNAGARARSGTVSTQSNTSNSGWPAHTTEAYFTVAAGASVTLHVPAYLRTLVDPVVLVASKDGTYRESHQLRRSSSSEAVLLLNVAPTSALASKLRGEIVPARHNPWAGMETRGISYQPVAEVATPQYDHATGSPRLPQRAAGYNQVGAVLLRSQDLSQLGSPSREALAGYVLGGGTLAIVVTRPEDLRGKELSRFLGGSVHEAPSHPETLEQIPSAPRPSGAPSVPHVDIEEGLVGRLNGYGGANLMPSLFGASSVYGMGEVHLLAFDPQNAPGVDSPWVKQRMIELLRRALTRRAAVLLNPGSFPWPSNEIRQHLDPAENTHWAIVLAALLLCAYAIVAGPVNFAYFKRRGRPLRALLWLPISSGLTFGAILVLGVTAKGCTGEARHLTLIEAGAGMSHGLARRWRGFRVPSAQRLEVRGIDRDGVVLQAQLDYRTEPAQRLQLDRDGLSLPKLQLQPWATVVIREDGYGALGAGIALLRDAGSDTIVVNRSGKRLRGLLLTSPGGSRGFLASLEDGERAIASAFTPVASVSAGHSSHHGLPFRPFSVHDVSKELESVSAKLPEAWDAASLALQGSNKDWFPPDVPVLLAQIDGGEGAPKDSGLKLTSDRVLLRVVGYGGAP